MFDIFWVCWSPHHVWCLSMYSYLYQITFELEFSWNIFLFFPYICIDSFSTPVWDTEKRSCFKTKPKKAQRDRQRESLTVTEPYLRLEGLQLSMCLHDNPETGRFTLPLILFTNLTVWRSFKVAKWHPGPCPNCCSPLSESETQLVWACCFHSLAVVNKTAVNMDEQASL